MKMSDKMLIMATQTKQWARIVAVVVIFFGILFFLRKPLPRTPPVIDIHTAIGHIAAIGEYACLACPYQTVYTYNEKPKKALYVLRGTAKLGFNFRLIKVEEEVFSGRTNIVFHMPDIELIGFKGEDIETYDEQDRVWKRITTKERDELWRQARKQQEMDISTNRAFRIQAIEATEKFFGTFIAALPGIRDNYGVELRWKEAEFNNGLKINDFR